MYFERRISWLLFLFDKHFCNFHQMPSKHSNTKLSNFPEKNNMLKADEDC